MANAAATADDAKAGGYQPNFARNLQQDIFAIALVAATLFVLVSVVTYNAADPVYDQTETASMLFTPDVTIYPGNEAITNACGYWGALLASGLLTGIGISTAFVIAAMGGVATALLTRGGMNAPVLRSLGGTLVVVAVANVAALSRWQPDGFPAVGAGGYLGAMTSTWLEMHFARPGAWILSLTGLLISLLLVTDYALWYAGWIVFRNGAMVSRKGIETASRALPVTGLRTRRIATDLDSPVTPVQPVVAMESATATKARATAASTEPVEATDGAVESEPSIKIRGKHRTGEIGDDVAANIESTPAKPAGPLSKVADGLAAAAAALHLTRSSDEQSESATLDEDEAYHDDDAPGDGPIEEPVTRELEVDGETRVLRNDEAHETSDFKIRVPKKREELQAVFDAVNEDLPEGADEYRLPSLDLLDESDELCNEDQIVEVRRKGKILEQTFKNFGFNIRVVEIETGPVISQYEVELEAGLRLSKITSLADDLAIALRVRACASSRQFLARIRLALRYRTNSDKWFVCEK